MTIDSLEDILLLIGSLLLNPLLPSFGLQTAISIAVGMILPQRVVEPINYFLHKIPGIRRAVCWFEEKLKKKRLKTVVPRILVGYFITSVTGGILLFIALLI